MRKCLLIFPAFLTIFFTVKYISAPLFSLKDYRFIQTGLLSEDHLASIKTYATQLLDSDYSAQRLIAQLKKEFPVLDKIVLAYRPCGVYIMLYAHKPICSLNYDHVLAANNELFTKNYFSLNALDSVPQICVASDYVSKVPLFVSSLLHELPSDFKEEYDLEIVNKHYVRLIDKKEKNFSIITSALQKEIPFLLAQCALIKKNISERKNFDERKKWVADVRFADYVIVYKT